MNQLEVEGDEYVYLIERADDGTLWAYFPDLPGTASCADTVEELVENAKEALGLYLDYYRGRNEPPPPRTHVGAGAAASPTPAENLVAGAGRR